MEKKKVKGEQKKNEENEKWEWKEKKKEIPKRGGGMKRRKSVCG